MKSFFYTKVGSVKSFVSRNHEDIECGIFFFNWAAISMKSNWAQRPIAWNWCFEPFFQRRLHALGVSTSRELSAKNPRRRTSNKRCFAFVRRKSFSGRLMLRWKLPVNWPRVQIFRCTGRQLMVDVRSLWHWIATFLSICVHLHRRKWFL